MGPYLNQQQIDDLEETYSETPTRTTDMDDWKKPYRIPENKVTIVLYGDKDDILNSTLIQDITIISIKSGVVKKIGIE